MQFIDDLVSPLLLKGQSLATIYERYKKELPCSLRTLYNYVDRCMLTARNIDMPRKVRFKKRYSHGDEGKRYGNEFVYGRTYKDYQQYMAEHPDAGVVEMDTVIGSKSRKCLLTLMICNCSLMIAILLPDKSQGSVCRALNDLCEAIGIEEFQRIFEVILTDRGTEFSNPYALECDDNGEIKSHLFYCDPYRSCQKPHVENNHELIRRVLPKGSCFDKLEQADITLMMNHINNYPRKSLNNTSPYEASKIFVGEKLLRALHFHKIRLEDVILRPVLMKLND